MDEIHFAPVEKPCKQWGEPHAKMLSIDSISTSCFFPEHPDKSCFPPLGRGSLTLNVSSTGFLNGDLLSPRVRLSSNSAVVWPLICEVSSQKEHAGSFGITAQPCQPAAYSYMCIVCIYMHYMHKLYLCVINGARCSSERGNPSDKVDCYDTDIQLVYKIQIHTYEYTLQENFTVFTVLLGDFHPLFRHLPLRMDKGAPKPAACAASNSASLSPPR